MIIKPKTTKRNYFTTTHGDCINDEYYWLRDNQWPNVENKKILDHLKEENLYSESFLKDHEYLVKELYLEMKNKMPDYDRSYPTKKDKHFYYSKIEKGSNHRIFCRKKQSLKNMEEVILDPNKLFDKDKEFSLGCLAINPKNEFLAYSFDQNGKESYQISVKNIRMKKVIESNVSNSIGNIIWHNNLPGFFYIRLDSNWRPSSIYFHYTDINRKTDKSIFKENNKKFRLSIEKSVDGKYIFIYSSSNNKNSIWYIDITKKYLVKPILIIDSKSNNICDIEHRRNEFFIRINDVGKNFRLISCRKNFLYNKKKWKEIISHENNSYFTSFHVSKKYLLINRKKNVTNKITIFDKTYKKRELTFDEETYESYGYLPSYKSNEIRIDYSSLKTPLRLLEFNFKKHIFHTRKQQKIFGNFNSINYTTEKIYAETKDKCLIPISLVYKKSLVHKNSTNPLLLLGYGSYGISMPTNFNKNVISLLDRGFIYAIAHIRGGGDLGYCWYESAKLNNKKITFSDFITCSKFLIEKKYTNPSKLIISGGSAGGMLIGAVINAEPNLFKGAIAQVPFVDVLNTMLDKTLPLTVNEFEEWGNPQKHYEDYKYIKSYCPYQNIKKQPYPAIFATSSLNDPRVGYWEPTKWISKIRELSTSQSPIFLMTDMEGGHLGKSGRFDSLKEISRIYTFLIKMTEEK